MKKRVWVCAGGKWRWRPVLSRVHLAGWLVIAWVFLLTLFSLSMHGQVPTLRPVEAPRHRLGLNTEQQNFVGRAGGIHGWAGRLSSVPGEVKPQKTADLSFPVEVNAILQEDHEQRRARLEPPVTISTVDSHHVDASRRRIHQVGARPSDVGESDIDHRGRSRAPNEDDDNGSFDVQGEQTSSALNISGRSGETLVTRHGDTRHLSSRSLVFQSDPGHIWGSLRKSKEVSKATVARSAIRNSQVSDNAPTTPAATPRLRSRSPERAEETVERRLKEDGFLQHAYNVTASDLLPLDREVPDTRPSGCPRQASTDLGSVGPVSVVICTHNEARSVLRRTVMSVLTRTPPGLLLEVIVVDDKSSTDDPARALEEVPAVNNSGKVRVLRADSRQGLVRSRLQGAREARGQILVFLDSHCECGVGWLQPLLEALLHDRKKVVSPYIDVIKSESFAYVRSPDDLQGDFNWRLEFGWRAIPPDVLSTRAGHHQPIRTPVISGGLFAVDRDFFYNIGSYDDLMDIWGGENMELSFRVWMCGGSLEILPCSRVGHVFRNLVPYSFPADPHTTVLTNLARAANVWMDQYSRFFFAAVNMSSSDTGDVTSRVALRDQLRCRSFQWYLDSVATHLDVPSPHATHFGQLKNKGSLLCLTAKFGSPDDLRLEACQGGKNQTIQLFLSGVLEAGGGCVVPGPNKHLTLYGCHLPQPQWNLLDGQLRLDKTGLCVTSVDNEFVRLAPCVSGSFFQLWEASFTFSWFSTAAITDG